MLTILRKAFKTELWPHRNSDVPILNSRVIICVERPII
jgi:hypothetical protein